MSHKLSKVAKSLNVGINNLVEFLQKKGVDIDNNPNARIDDEQYSLLLEEFDKDKKLRKKAQETTAILHKREVKPDVVAEPEKENIPTESANAEGDSANGIVQPKVLRTIDLDALNPSKKTDKKKQNSSKTKNKVDEAKGQQPKPEANADKKPYVEAKPKDEVKPEPVAPQPVPTVEAQPKEVVEVVELVKAEPAEQPALEAVEVKKTPEIPAPEVKEVAEKIDSENVDSSNVDDEPFRLKSNAPKMGVTVVGKVDLSSLDEKTRPDKKSKHKKDQRNDNKKSHGKAQDKDGEQPQSKKKRPRFRAGQVDINKPQGNTNNNQNNNNNQNKPSKSKLKKPVKPEVNNDDVQQQVKETLAKLTAKKKKKTGADHRREKREHAAMRQEEQFRQQQRESTILEITEFVTANDLANMMDVAVTQVISTCMSFGVMVAINQRLDAETINIVAEEFGFKTKFVSADVVEAISEEVDNPEDLLPRPPIVTVMGHVDHGKTSLLDSIRSTNVIAGEAGGITQHIGAYNVSLPDGRRITFLDTPGHEAFTAMRARGAQITDVAIIIVAADDSVMPQTVEAINHAAAAGVPMVFAINKIDKPGANPDKIKERLAEMNYLVEEWGGKYQSQEISAKKGIGIQDLLEKVLLEADLLELKANPNRRATGSIIESSLDKGRGYVATVLVENGTLKQGDIVLAGSYFGRVKAMFNERNSRIDEAKPAAPALILGLNGAPQAGDKFHVMETEQEARSIAQRREQLQREQSLRTQKMLTLDDIGRRIAIGNFQQLNIIVKGDVDGSVEALSDSLIQLSTEEIQVNVIHKAVGQISESDIVLAAASDAVIVGFQVRPSLGARKEAEKEGVDIRLYSVIYDAIEEVKSAMEGMLSPDIKEEVVGNAEVLEVFKISKVGTIAGCMVRDGKIKRTNNIRLIRDGIVIFTGVLDSLKRFKDDVKEVTNGYECGLSIKNFNDIKVGDMVEAFEEVEVKKTL